MLSLRSASLIAILGIGCAACEKCAPGQVGAGVGRLTVRNVGAVADLINNDNVCGFESAAVKESFQASGAVGSQGSVTWSVDGCVLDYTHSPNVTHDCNQVETKISGRVKVSARRTVAGTLTGDPAQPVIPISPDAVTLELTKIELESFRVAVSNSDAVLTQYTGTISAKIRPRLGTAASTGVCSIPTKNAALFDIVWVNGHVRVKNDGHDFEVDVPASNLHAINGRHSGQENTIGGTITVWETPVELPNDGDGLDPNYNRAKFDASYACTQDLKQPTTFECGDVGTQLGQAAARLTIRNMGAIAHIVEHDTTCGFSSPDVERGAMLSGPPGANGDATMTVSSCRIEIPANTVLKTSCSGTKTMASGVIVVSGTKKLSGRLTGDVAQPVVPTNDNPAEIVFSEIRFEDFKIEESGTSLRQIAGAISGRVVPRVAMDLALGACAAETPIARFSDIRYMPGTRVELSASQGTFATSIDDSNLTAVNGTWMPDSNMLRGTIMMGDKSYSLPTNPNDDGLDPMFEQSAFDASWQCGSVNVQAPFECSFVKALGQGTAQLSALALGTLTDLVEKDTNCGFSSRRVTSAAAINGMLGNPGGTATLTISSPCQLSFAMQTTAKSDCNGKATYVSGTALITGTETLAGYVSGDPAQPIVPTTRDPASLSIQATLTNFRVWQSGSDNSLEVKSGVLSGTVKPRTAIDTTTGACSIPTPVAALSTITYRNASLQVKSQGKTFDIHVASSNLSAVNGSRDGMTNSLSGAINIDGTDIAIPVSPGAGLDPTFSQSVFDASFACTRNMRIPASDAECNMKKPLGEGTARLIVKALGALTGVANKDSRCGFSANLTHPSRVEGNPGQQGALEWTINNCELPNQGGRGGGGPIDTDCLQRKQFLNGYATVGGMRRVTGTRQDIRLVVVTFHSITPNSPQSVTVNMNNLALHGLVNYDLDPGQQAPRRAITIHSGTMSAKVEPITGEERNTPGKFDIPTKVARMSNVVLNNATVTIVNEGKTFNLHVDSANLSAFNGSYRMMNLTNVISGQISVDGQMLTLPSQPLDPEYSQADFDRRYACTQNLRGLIPPAP